METKDKLMLFRDSCKSSLAQGLQELDELIEKKDYINAEIRLDYLNGLIRKIKVNFQGSWEILN